MSFLLSEISLLVLKGCDQVTSLASFVYTRCNSLAPSHLTELYKDEYVQVVVLQ